MQFDSIAYVIRFTVETAEFCHFVTYHLSFWQRADLRLEPHLVTARLQTAVNVSQNNISPILTLTGLRSRTRLTGPRSRTRRCRYRRASQ